MFHKLYLVCAFSLQAQYLRTLLTDCYWVELTWTALSLVRWHLSRTLKNLVHSCLNLSSAERNSILIWSHVVFQNNDTIRTRKTRQSHHNSLWENQVAGIDCPSDSPWENIGKFKFALSAMSETISRKEARKINRHPINVLTLSISNGISSELGCSSTSVLTKKKIRPLEQHKSHVCHPTQNSKWDTITVFLFLLQLLDNCAGKKVGDFTSKCTVYLSRHNPAPQ